MAECGRCGERIEETFRFCPWCAAPQRVKLVEFFRGHPSLDGGERALRVSRYLGAPEDEPHVRFSVWTDAGRGRTRVEAAVSLEEDEADRLARFLAGSSRDRVG
jgi:hypothetical protein